MSVDGAGVRGRLRSTSGVTVPGDVWLGDATEVDHRVLARCDPPVLDVGCGPARHTAALAERGLPTLGIDITPGALSRARPRDVVVLERDIFDRVPAAGRWGTVLLLDGNVGIGGDPPALLRRARELLRPGGKVLVELLDETGPMPGGDVRLELDDLCGPWFRWTAVCPQALRDGVSAVDGLATRQVWCDGDRWFAELVSAAGP